MRSSRLFLGVVLASMLPLASQASDAAPTGADELPVIRWEDFDDPAFDPTVGREEPAVVEDRADAGKAASANGVVLGPVGMDTQGRRGRIHFVVTGDTLWDISEAYLGTPWVWPSVWNENGAIRNPHLISPGDRIWITSNEMRSVTEEEAEQFVAAEEAGEEEIAEVPVEEAPAASSPVVELEPVAPMHVSPVSESGREVLVSWRESMGFVTDAELKASSSIVGSPEPRTWLASGDQIYIGLGEGEVEVGDQFTAFDAPVPILDPDTRRLLGHHIAVLGWIEVTQVTGETAIAMIRQSSREMARGVRILPRDKENLTLKGKPAPAGVEAQIIYMPSGRTLMGSIDYVFLNRGSVDGFEEGTALDVYERGRLAYDSARGTSVQLPDRTIANLYVVSVQPESAVAFVYHTVRELDVGDIVRGSRTRASLQN